MGGEEAAGRIGTQGGSMEWAVLKSAMSVFDNFLFSGG
jgi:hypothetical protein